MAKSVGDLSVAKLEQMLNHRKQLLTGLKKRESRLQKELDDVQKRIGAIEGSGIGGTVRRKRTGKRAKNSKSLHEVVLDLLSKNKKGYPLTPLGQKVLESGYKSNSTNFNNVLYQCLYNSKKIVHDPSTGTYKLAQ